ncbi:MAG: polysaccharide biosynthesis tyrosine autokinase [Bryobacterales bacterium]|nr:polysaccharide biosynthesis tyrosine autokinase [Bryobacterales bacterium]
MSDLQPTKPATAAIPAANGSSYDLLLKKDYLDVALRDGDGEPDATALLRYAGALHRRWGTLLVCGLLGAVVGLVMALSQPAQYRARATVEIQAINQRFLNTDDVDPMAGTRSGADLPTEIAVMQSESMIKRAREKALAQPQPVIQSQPHPLWSWLQSAGVVPKSQRTDWPKAIAMAASKVKVAPLGVTRVVEITTESVDAQAAAVFVNALADVYIDQSIEARWQSAQRVNAWLSRQLADLRDKLQKSEAELQNYGRSAGLLFSAGSGTVATDKLRQLREELLKAQSAKRDQQARYLAVSNARPETLLEVVEDPVLRSYQIKLSDLRQQMAELSTTFTPEHYRVQRLQAQIQEVEGVIQRERNRIVNRFRNDFEFASGQEKELAAAYSAQERTVSNEEEKTIKYNLIRREVETTRQLYDAMLQKMKEASVAQTMLANNIRVVDPAQPSKTARSADPMRNGFMGFFGGGLLCAGLIVLVTALDPRFRSPGQASASLGLPELGVIPAAESDPGMEGHRVGGVLFGARKLSGLRDSEGNGPAGDHVSGRLELVTWDRKPSMLAESFRAVLTSILVQGDNGNAPRVLAITSSVPQEGKSTVTSNLGLALAETSRRVLLIDADLRRPRLHSVYNVPNTWGLSDLLREKGSLQTCPLEGLVRPTSIPGLSVLPSGPEALNIASLLTPGRLAELLDRFRGEFDRIFIDTPPVMQMVDARLIGRLADGVILVLRAGHTSRSIAMMARKRLSDDGCRILGTVLNDWRPEGFLDHHYYTYYHSR